ncbi:hypothetical protein BT96DRAFT_942042 [Gymnopus androsaceus JB14]|uniref:Uncharacterized protein n=1 Tax=Gymnopus androsaceus JB14 TaxID=1447944 RepID=A0A6A4HGD7_9AGAR|nr:hypothetical protein BT96DRAFT_942042 [Gymnopus androsaceus JB14]
MAMGLVDDDDDGLGCVVDDDEGVGSIEDDDGGMGSVEDDDDEGLGSVNVDDEGVGSVDDRIDNDNVDKPGSAPGVDSRDGVGEMIIDGSAAARDWYSLSRSPYLYPWKPGA